MKKLILLVLFIPPVCVAQNPKIKDFKITILSTMLSDTHIGEWGFSAIIEADGRRILFDTGSREKTVLQNARELKINLENIDNVFLSHNHKDHTGGLKTLRENYPTSFSNAHIGEFQILAFCHHADCDGVAVLERKDRGDGGEEPCIRRIPAGD